MSLIFSIDKDSESGEPWYCWILGFYAGGVRYTFSMERLDQVWRDQRQYGDIVASIVRVELVQRDQCKKEQRSAAVWRDQNREVFENI